MPTAKNLRTQIFFLKDLSEMAQLHLFQDYRQTRACSCLGLVWELTRGLVLGITDVCSQVYLGRLVRRRGILIRVLIRRRVCLMLSQLGLVQLGLMRLRRGDPIESDLVGSDSVEIRSG